MQSGEEAWASEEEDMNDRETIEWLLQVMYWLRVLGHGESCQKQDQAEEWLKEKLNETKV